MCTNAVWPSRRMVSTMPSDVSGLTKDDAPSAGVAPAGSAKYRLEAGGSGFDNLILAGDWIYNGLNVGSFEGAVMGGKLAANAAVRKEWLEV